MTFAINHLEKALILDTETTGIGNDDEIIELAIIRADNGEVLFNQRFKPTKTISAEAFAIHGISDDELKDKPRFADHFADIVQIVNGKTIIGWRVDFDVLFFHQTKRRYAIPDPKGNGKTHDFKLDYTRYLDEIDDDYFVTDEYFDDELDDVVTNHDVHLVTACEHENIDISDLNPHRALDDCQMLYRLLHHLRQKNRG